MLNLHPSVECVALVLKTIPGIAEEGDFLVLQPGDADFPVVVWHVLSAGELAAIPESAVFIVPSSVKSRDSAAGATNLPLLGQSPAPADGSRPPLRLVDPAPRRQSRG